MDLKFPGWVLLVLLCCSGALQAAEQNVMMIAKVVRSGTTMSQVVFFNSAKVTTLEKCNEEKRLGLSFGWREFNHRFNKKSGQNFQVNYQCVNSDKQISPWSGGSRSKYKKVYFVKVEGEFAHIEKADTYMSCIKKVRALQKEESHKIFCGASNQKITSG